MNIKVEDAIARAQTPAPMLNPDEENLRQQVRVILLIGQFRSSAKLYFWPSHTLANQFMFR